MSQIIGSACLYHFLLITHYVAGLQLEAIDLGVIPHVMRNLGWLNHSNDATYIQKMKEQQKNVA